MTLNAFGILALTEIAFYAPVLCGSIYLTLNRGFNRNSEGWLFLSIFSAMRLIGAFVTIELEMQNNSSTRLFVADVVVKGICLSPLLMATLGFVSSIAHRVGNMNYKLLLRLFHVLFTVGLIMEIVGVTKITPDNDEHTMSQGHTFSKVASVLFIVTFSGLFGVVILLWGKTSHIPPNHRTLLIGVTLAVPFIFIRIIYGLLNAFSSSLHNRWSPIEGTWWIYFIMEDFMEYIVASLYVITGAFTPLEKDEDPRAAILPVAVPQSPTAEDASFEMGFGKWRQKRRECCCW